MAFDEASHPANPQNAANTQSNWFYPDRSGFQYDLPPRYVCSGWFSTAVESVYDLPRLPINTFDGLYSGWTMWLDKVQKDYRFGAFSDSNAEANIYPEVHDPWMFTEYVVHGTGKSDDLDDATTQNKGIVEPPLLNPVVFARDLISQGDANIVDETHPTLINDQRPTYMRREQFPVHDLENEWEAEDPLTHVKRKYWEGDLVAKGWKDQNSDDTENKIFTRTGNQRRVVRYSHEYPNAGVRIYRHNIWSYATRWGHSQNTPEHTFNLTAPKEWCKPTGVFTGRIVPQVTIEWGIPIYDNIPNEKQGGQWAIRYDSYGATATMKIGLFDRTSQITGIDGIPDSKFTYPKTPTSVTGALLVPMPRDNLVTLIWNDPKYVNDDLVHHGCQFWKGEVTPVPGNTNPDFGTARCTYYENNSASFGIIWQDEQTFTPSPAPFPTLAVQPFNVNQYVIEVTYENGPVNVNVESAGKKLVYVTGAGGLCTGINIVTLSNQPAKPFATNLDEGFSTVPGSSAKVTLKLYAKQKPSPHKKLCALYNGTGIEDAKQNYRAAGGKCPYYSPVGKRVLTSYKAQSHNGAEWANLQRGMPSGSRKSPLETAQGEAAMGMAGAMGGLGAGVGAGFAWAWAASSPVPSPFPDENISDDYQRITVEFVPERIEVSGKQRYYDTFNGQPPYRDPEAKIRIKSGTGFHLMDDKDTEPYGGVDTPFFGFVNQINYRIGRNVQHCYNSEKCDPIITSGVAAPGWRRGRYSNIDFTSHPLRMPGFPALDGTDRYCHTGDRLCPFNRLDRRAAEYNANYLILIEEILRPFRIGGIQAFSGLQEAYLLPNGKIRLDPPGSELAEDSEVVNSLCVAVAPRSAHPTVIGHYLASTEDDVGDEYYIYFYYDRSSADPFHKQSHVYAHIVQFDDTNNACYMTPPEDPNESVAWTRLFGDDQTAPWLTEMFDDYREPSGYAVQVTNQMPFIAGRAPEYKDHSKMGTMIMSPWGGIVNNTYIAGANGNQFGGVVAQPIIEGQQRRSYWTDSDGEWILDGRKIGVGQGFVEPRARMRNKPGVYGDRHPIDGIPGNKVEDPSKPGGNIGNSDWASTGYTYSNDTKSFLEWLQDVWNDYLPDDPDADEPGTKIHIGAPSAETEFLPRERKWYRCTSCGSDFPHEEVKFLKPLRVRAGDYPQVAHRVVPLSSGITSNTMVPLYPVPSGQAGEVGCPQYDGGSLVYQGGYDRFMGCYSRGYVQFWGPPGSTVDRRGYFWKNPTLINRAHYDHASNKLGKYNPGNAGGYSFSTLNQTVEKMGRLPLTTAKQYKVGLSHQITAPWAAPGETVHQVLDRMKPLFNILDSDSIFVQPKGTDTLEQVGDTSRSLVLNDIIQIWRFNNFAQIWDRIGIPIIACATLPSIIANQQIILDDPDRPEEADFPDADAYNRELKQWMMNVVSGTLQHYSSNPYMLANALAVAMQNRGLSDAAAYPVNPTTGDHRVIDERIVDAYGATEEGGLKMVTIDHWKRLRNRVLPMFGYDITGTHYKAGGDYYDRIQAGYRKRFATTEKPVPIKRYTRIHPQVFAATERGIDYYVEWELGDFTNDKARAYYPVGATWWRIEQRVGHIRRSGGTNWFHLDDSTNSNFRFPYTGNNIVSSVTYFLHGTIPMDKEVVRALLIYTPEDPPSMDAIGCQGQYTGFVGLVDIYGGVNQNTYEGHSFCYWQHYHGFTTNHERAIPATYWDRGARFHVLAGHVEGCVTFTEAENTYTLCNYFQSNGLTDDGGPNPFAEIEVTIVPQEVPAEMDYIPSVAGGTDKLYTKQTELLGLQYEDVRHGFEVTQPYLAAWTFGQPIVQMMTEHEVWKDWTFEKYTTYYNRYHVNAQAAVNTFESVQSLQYFGSEFRGTHFPQQSQGIPGWLDYRGYDSAGRFPVSVDIEVQKTDSSWASGGQVLVQEEASTVSSNGNSNRIEGGGNGSQQTGNAPKVMDVTDTIRRLYNQRVDRYFKAVLGAAYEQLFDLVKSRTDTNLGTVERFHQGTYDPLYFWNYRFMGQFGSFKAGMWINDPWHHPALIADRPLTSGGSGDPLPHSQEDKEARVNTVSDWDTQDLEETDPNYKQYHPYSLLTYTNPNTFDEDTEVSEISTPRPTPLSVEDRYWRVIDDNAFAHYFEMDLRQTPYETERRPWRYEPGHTDSTNALCPNMDCLVHQNGWTVGQYYAQATTTWGLGVIPSTTSEYCANCGTKLIGTTEVGGDGILTVAYDDPHVSDVMINAIEAGVDHPSWNATAKHGFAVEYFNTKISQWRTLFSVTYDSALNKYRYQQWDGNNWIQVQNAVLPPLFKGCEGINGVPKNRSGSIGCHFTIVTGVKVRFKVPKPAVVNQSYPEVPVGLYPVFGDSFPNPPGGYVDILPFTEQHEDLIGRSIILRDGGDPASERQLKIVGAQRVGGNLRLMLQGEFLVTNTEYRVVWKDYVSRCTKFRVYGFPYQEGEVIITDPGYLQPLFISVGNNSFRLNNWPSQIASVTCQVGDGITIPMVETTNEPTLPNGDPNPNFYWTVQQDTFDGKTYFSITNGVWYYDYNKNSVVVPAYYKHPVTNELASIWELNLDLYNDVDEPLTLKTLPTFVAVEYLVGLGMSVDVNVESVGDGPSYQLEPECIQFVCSPTGNGSTGGYTEPNGFNTAILPAIGQSVRLKSLAGSKMNLLWHCYNKEPIIWSGQMAWMVGDELMNTGQGGAWGDDDVANLLTGKLGKNLSDIGLKDGSGNVMGATSPIRGKATGKVTLYGSASTILSGDLLVLARAYTTRQYNLIQNNVVQTVKMEERTGGMRSGFFTFRLNVTDSVSNRRTGITCSVPRVMVYLRERKLTDQISKG